MSGYDSFLARELERHYQDQEPQHTHDDECPVCEGECEDSELEPEEPDEPDHELSYDEERGVREW